MNTARKNQVDLGAIIGSELQQRDDQDTAPQETTTPDPEPQQEERAAARAEQSRRRQPRRKAAPSAEDIVAPKPQQVRRRPLNVDVPEDLQLHRRMHQCRIEQGVDIRDQAALAIDAWLRGQGF